MREAGDLLARSLYQSKMLPLYTLTLFISAALLFVVQPMVAKLILPHLGGSPSVWTVCLLFFQATLLLGYTYAHVATSRLGVRKQSITHILLVSLALAMLPLNASLELAPAVESDPALYLLTLLVSLVGLPFFLLSTTTPMLQRWVASTTHVAARDPYFLYWASNGGSMMGLLAYPFLIEPYLTLSQQLLFWSYGYFLFAVLMLPCSYFLWRSQSVSAAQLPSPSTENEKSGISLQPVKITPYRRMRWVMLSFAPSTLLLGTTTYITTDIAPAPLLWIVPLTLYLLSFILVFLPKPIVPHRFFIARLPFLILASAITVFSSATDPPWLLIPLHLVTFFTAAMVCHGELSKDRPAPKNLTEFYMCISFGGVLGGIFNALVAPAIFTTLVEYPLAMILVGLLRPRGRSPDGEAKVNLFDFALPLVLGIAAGSLIPVLQAHPGISPRTTHLVLFGLGGVICLSFAKRTIRFALGLAALLITSTYYTGPYGRPLVTERSFFGVYRVMLDSKEEHHLLLHGNTVHGIQSRVSERRLEPLSYYSASGPIGQVFAVDSRSNRNAPVAIVGLGTGSLACYGRAGQQFVFYEIDPLVERLARDRRYFTYLDDCAPQSSVVLGDARISLTRAADHYYGLIVLDAFSSDAIPTHLLTKEALELYLSKLSGGGLLAFHVSNRHLDLEPVLARLGRELGLVGFIQNDTNVTDNERGKGKEPSRWVVMARRQQDFDGLLSDARWQPLQAKLGTRVWTDDFSNVLDTLRWW